MNAIMTDLMAVIGVVLNGLPQGLLALAYGFASVPTALAFFVGAIGNTVTQSVAPISSRLRRSPTPVQPARTVLSDAP